MNTPQTTQTTPTQLTPEQRTALEEFRNDSIAVAEKLGAMLDLMVTRDAVKFGAVEALFTTILSMMAVGDPGLHEVVRGSLETLSLRMEALMANTDGIADALRTELEQLHGQQTTPLQAAPPRPTVMAMGRPSEA
jgi:hypothetical protein